MGDVQTRALVLPSGSVQTGTEVSGSVEGAEYRPGLNATFNTD